MSAWKLIETSESARRSTRIRGHASIHERGVITKAARTGGRYSRPAREATRVWAAREGSLPAAASPRRKQFRPARWCRGKGQLHSSEEASIIHVRRADDRELVVENHGLGMKHDRLVKQHLASRLVQIAKVAFACQVGREMVGPGRNDQPDVHAPSRCQAQGAAPASRRARSRESRSRSAPGPRRSMRRATHTAGHRARPDR